MVSAPADAEDDKINHYLHHVGDTYPERKVKPRHIPQWPEGTVQRHDPIELDLSKTYPSAAEYNKDKFVSSEQESSTLVDPLLMKDDNTSELTMPEVPAWYAKFYDKGLEYM